MIRLDAKDGQRLAELFADARKRIKRELADLSGKEERLPDLVAGGSLDTDKVRERLSKLQVQRAGLTQRLETTDDFLQQESDTLLAYLRLLEQPGAFCAATRDIVKRKLLGAHFRQIWIDDDGYQVKVDPQCQPIVAQIEASAREGHKNEQATEHLLGGFPSFDPALNSKAVCSSSNVLVHTVDRRSNKPTLTSPSLGALAKLAQQAQNGHQVPTVAEAAPVPSRSIRRRLAPKVIEELVARYTAGESIRALSWQHGLSRSGLSHFLEGEGVVLREQGITPEGAERAVRLYESGLTIRQVAERLGSSHGTIQRVLNKQGVSTRASCTVGRVTSKK
jgi:hypothetical protein